MNVTKTFMQTLNRAALCLAVCLLTLTSGFALTNESHKLQAENEANFSFEPAATVKSTWVDYNATEGGRKGMRIHVNFEVTGLKGVDTKILARVQKTDGDFLTSGSSYSNDEGQLETSYSLKPGYATTVYEDAPMFMPYSELNLRRGTSDLKFDIDLAYEGGDLIQHLAYKNFTFTAPNYAEDSAEKEEISTKLNKVWVDYDVYEEGSKGMMIHVNFEVTGLKGVDSKLVARVQKSNGDFLMNDSSNSNDSGELEVSFSMKPGYPTTVYKDAQMFLPYDEMVLRKGAWNLKLDIDLSYENGDLIEHLAYHDFEFTR